VRGRPCRICNHTDSFRIDADLVSGTQRAVAQKWGVPKTNISRHVRNHLPERLHQVQAAKNQAAAPEILERLAQLERSTIAVLAEARQSHDPTVALKAIGRALQLLEFQAKLTGQLREGPGVTLNVDLHVDDETALRMLEASLSRRGLRILPAPESVAIDTTVAGIAPRRQTRPSGQRVRLRDMDKEKAHE